MPSSPHCQYLFALHGQLSNPLDSPSEEPTSADEPAERALHAGAAEATTIDARALTERAHVLRPMREHEAELRAQGVTRLRLSGSVARGEAGPDSDVDLIAEIDRTIGLSLLDLVGLQDFLRDLLDRKVDVGTTVDKMRPRMRQRFEAEAIEVF